MFLIDYFEKAPWVEWSLDALSQTQSTRSEFEGREKDNVREKYKERRIVTVT